MRILIVSDAWKPQINGVVRTYEGLNRQLEAGGHRVRVIGPADFPRRMKMPGYAEIELALLPARRLKTLIDDFMPETIHIATEGPLGWAMRALCRRRNWPFTTAYHSHFPDYAAMRAAKLCPALYQPVRNLGIRFIRSFHAPSSAVLTTTASVDRTLQEWKVKAPLYRLTRGVDTEIFHPGPGPLFDHLPRPCALYAGRVAIEKNIEAFLDMPWTGSKIVVGGGPELKRLRALYPNVLFTGTQQGQTLADHYRSADVFVFPSRTDTFGIVLIEAMACGLPLAGYKVPGPADIIIDPLLGAIDNDLAMAAATATASPRDKPARFAHLKQHYSWDIASQQFITAQKQAVI